MHVANDFKWSLNIFSDLNLKSLRAELSISAKVKSEMIKFEKSRNLEAFLWPGSKLQVCRQECWWPLIGLNLVVISPSFIVHELPSMTTWKKMPNSPLMFIYGNFSLLFCILLLQSFLYSCGHKIFGWCRMIMINQLPWWLLC